MDQLQVMQEAVARQNIQIEMLGFVINLVSAAVLSLLLAWIYVKFGKTHSDRKQFAHTFMLITMTTMLIITIVKSSLALSLGLVGALSIVRFRAAIKEPEELSYLFLAIALGLGLGANQRLITLSAFLIISGIIWLRSLVKKSQADDHNMVLTLCGKGSEKLEQASALLKEHCISAVLKRLEEGPERFEAMYLVELQAFDQLLKLKAALLGLELELAFVDRRGIS